MGIDFYVVCDLCKKCGGWAFDDNKYEIDEKAQRFIMKHSHWTSGCYIGFLDDNDHVDRVKSFSDWRDISSGEYVEEVEVDSDDCESEKEVKEDK